MWKKTSTPPRAKGRGWGLGDGEIPWGKLMEDLWRTCSVADPLGPWARNGMIVKWWMLGDFGDYMSLWIVYGDWDVSSDIIQSSGVQWGQPVRPPAMAGYKSSPALKKCTTTGVWDNKHINFHVFFGSVEIHSIGGASNFPACLPLWVKKCQAKAAEENELWLSLQFVCSITGVASCNPKLHQSHSSDTDSHFSGGFFNHQRLKITWSSPQMPHWIREHDFLKKTHQNLGFLGCLHVFTPTFSDQIWRQPFCCPCSSQPRPAPAPRPCCAFAAPSRPVPFLRPSPPFRRRQAPGRWPWGPWWGGKCWGHPGPGPPGWKRRSRSQQLGGIGVLGSLASEIVGKSHLGFAQVLSSF